MNKIYLATNNPGKVEDLQKRLSNVLNIKVSSLNELPQFSDIEETGTTYEENALLKARLIASHTNCITIADDSGLEVSALGNRPGVYSHRYSDDWDFLPNETFDQRNIRKMLFELQTMKNRSAKYVCCLVAVKPTGEEIIIKSYWNGIIINEMKGTNGFGYDPIFFDPKLNKTASELTNEEKFNVSHRGKAMNLLVQKLKNFI